MGQCLMKTTICYEISRIGCVFAMILENPYFRSVVFLLLKNLLSKIGVKLSKFIIQRC